MRYGSFFNTVMGDSAPAPEVGMGATELCWTDRHAYTVTRVSPSGKTFWARRDRAIRVDGHGMSDAQEYRYEPNPEAPEVMVRLRKNGEWGSKGARFALGYRAEYYDFSF